MGEIRLASRLFVALVVLWVWQIVPSVVRAQTPTAHRGVIDLRSYAFAHQAPVALEGQWAVYWHQFYSPGQLQEAQHIAPPRYLPFAQHWNEQAGHSGHGYATYHLRVLLPRDVPAMALQLNQLSTAYELYVDGRLAHQSRRVGTSRAQSEPYYRPLVLPVTPRADTLDLVLHISNFHHRMGGPWLPLYLGEFHRINQAYQSSLLVEVFLLGSILIMALYHLGLSLVRRGERSAMLFGLFAAVIVLRISATGQMLLMHLWPNLPWEVLIKTEYLSFYLAVPLFMEFARSLFPSVFPRWWVRSFSGLAGGFALLVLFSPARIYSYTPRYYELLTVANGLFLLVALVRLQGRNEESARTFLVGFLIMFATVINDILYQRGLITSINTISFGLFAFIFMQAFLLSKRFSRTFQLSEQLAYELHQLSQNQELLIAERTHELEIQKAALETSGSELEHALAELQQANYELVYQTVALNETAGVVLTDARGRIMSVNRSFEIMSGYVQAELVGHTFERVKSGVHPPEFYQNMWKMLAVHHCNWVGEICNRRKDGQLYWLRTTIVPYLDLEGEAYQYMAVSFDITHTKLAEFEIQQQNAELAEKNERITRIHQQITSSIQYATRIQRAVLSSPEALNAWFADARLGFRPRDLVSGDFYFFAQLEHTLVVVVADCTGHGVPGGFMSMLGIALLNDIVVHRRISQPDLVAEQMRRLIVQALSQQHDTSTTDGIDLSICTIDSQRQELLFAGAHQDVLLLRHGRVRVLRGSRQSASYHPRPLPFELTRLALQTDDRLFLYTDGLPDQLGGDHGLKFGSARLRASLESTAELTLAEQEHYLWQRHEQWRHTLPQTDDVLLLAIEVSTQRLQLLAQSRHQADGAVVQALGLGSN